MTKALLKNTFREIRNTKARFISIMAIIALGVGFFAGIKSTTPSMYKLAESFYSDNSLMDFRLVSTVGFTEEDVNEVMNAEEVTSVMPSYYTDILTTADSGGDVVRLISTPEKYKDNEPLNNLELTEGRLPEKAGEVVVESDGINSLDYKLGDTISFVKTSGETDYTKTLGAFEYKVVGFVRSPLYISYQRGNTTVGNGKILMYMYTSPESFCVERWTELYVKTTASERYSAFSDEYENEIDRIKSKLQTIADSRCNVLKNELDKNKEELEEAKRKLNSEKESVYKKLDDAKEEIEKGKREYEEKIAEAKKQLESAKNQIDDAKSELEKGRLDFKNGIYDGKLSIEENEKKLADARKQYNSGKAEFDSKIAEAEKKLDNAYMEYNTADKIFTEYQEPLIQLSISVAQTAIDIVEQITIASPDEPVAKYGKERLKEMLGWLNATYDSAVNQLNDARRQLEAGQRQFDEQKSAGEKELAAALAKLEDGEKQLAEGKKQLLDKTAEGAEQLIDGQKQLSDAELEYKDGLTEFDKQKENGKTELDKAQDEYEKGKQEADKKFEDAEKEIAEADQKLAGVAEPKWYLFTRNDNPGYSTFSDNCDRLDAVAVVFPLFFLLVAVLVCVTTMTRLIEEKRTEIGTLKALGYSNTSITLKFVLYSLIAGVAGAIIGTAIGITTLPFIIFNAYKIMYYIGDISLVPDLSSIFISMLAAVMSTMLVSIIICYRSLRNKPASLMRPKTPKAGKRIIFEYITPLWKRLSFSSKLMVRNLLRYKSRLCMTVIGIAGCTALIVAGFGLLNSFYPMTHDQFESIYKYDTVIIPKTAGSEKDLSYITDKLSADNNVEKSMLMSQKELEISFGRSIMDKDVYLSVMQSTEGFDEIIDLHTRKDKKKLTLSDDGVLVNEKLANTLGVIEGDTVTLKLDGKLAQVKVLGIYEQYISSFVYMTPALYRECFDFEPEFNMLDIRLKDIDSVDTDKFSKSYLTDDRIAAVSFVRSSIDDFDNMLSSLNLVVLVMVICAAMLAIVVLYNLTNINIAERVREIATFKVLGFDNRETSSFIFRENIALTILGTIVGLVLGIFLSGFVVQTVEVNNVMFGREIFFTTYIYAAVLTMVFSLLVNLVMSFKIKKINMVESLKSIE